MNHQFRARGAAALLICVWGCGDGVPLSAVPPAPAISAGQPAAAYDPRSDGFVVHEWGTFTQVMASDGSLLPGLHHEEEDLPSFVADRMKQAGGDPTNPALVSLAGPINAKLETPVTYFYSPRPLQVRVSARFPQGFFSQWFPHVTKMDPPIMDLGNLAVHNLVDRWMQRPEDIPAGCQARYAGEMANGLLDWGTVKVLGRDRLADLLPSPPAMTWGFARNTAANPVEVDAPGAGAQREKFLFYRGLGRLDLPLAVRSERPGLMTLDNRDGVQPIAATVVMVVTRQGAGYRALGGLAAGASRSAELPAPALALPAFVDALKHELAGLLAADGLYADEAQAMVDTWERSYFLTPGVRVLYLLPQPTTDRILPLAVNPPPATLRRTVVIRVEALAPDFEANLAAAARQLIAPSPDDAAAGRAFFLAQGRFAEPYLTRALALIPEAAATSPATQLLTEVRNHHRWSPAWAE
jgi:hypothetical protein